MPSGPLTLSNILDLLEQPDAMENLVEYFGTRLPEGSIPRFTGGRFERLGGGGDKSEVANRITTSDLVAVELLSVQVPAPVALQLLEGDLGKEVGRLLACIPADVAIHDPRAAALLADNGPVDSAWSLLERQHGMGWVTAGKLLARKRPHLVPVWDNVVRCALGRPPKVWLWMVGLLHEEAGILASRLNALRDTAGIPDTVSLLRVLDVIVWRAHQAEHSKKGCAGLQLHVAGS